MRRFARPEPLMIFVMCLVVGGGVFFLGAAYSNRQKDAATAAAANAIQVAKAKSDAKILAAKDAATHVALLNAYNAGVKACGRGNTLRRNLNQVIGIQRDFLVTARTARLAAVAAATDPAVRSLNQQAADNYRIYIKHLKSLAIVDCLSVYTKPE